MHGQNVRPRQAFAGQNPKFTGQLFDDRLLFAGLFSGSGLDSSRAVEFPDRWSRGTQALGTRLEPHTKECLQAKLKIP